MKLFLDTSVLLAACGSASGASREIFGRSRAHGWTLLSVPYVVEEAERNLRKMPDAAGKIWPSLRQQLVVEKDVLTFPNPVVFEKTKDRPVLASAFAYAEVLLTLDYIDFMDFLGRQFYGLAIMEPGEFLGRLRGMEILRGS